jgi:alanine-glyoxylate transaminase/serine-glyoxylate transaminase/serine-pyruvate transaminase
MTVASGREILAIPGPTNIPDAVLAAMHRPAIDIYSGDMLRITRTLLEDLPRLFRTTGQAYIYAANGHGGWEAAVSNVLSRGQTILVLESGLFAVAWGDMTGMLGVKVEVLKGHPRRAVDPAAVAQRLRADTGREIKAVLVVQIDTASGIVNDIAAIGHAIAAAGHPALLLVDCVASLGCMPFEMDAWGVDVAMAGSQKGLMTPPGLAFVAANARAHAAHQKADLRTRYWDWTFRQGRRTTRSTAARRPSTCCSGCARPSTCCSPRAWRRRPAVTRCWPRRPAAPSAAGRTAACWPSTSPRPPSGRTR